MALNMAQSVARMSQAFLLLSHPSPRHDLMGHAQAALVPHAESV